MAAALADMSPAATLAIKIGTLAFEAVERVRRDRHLPTTWSLT
jgi:hypothetical protein